MATLTIRKVDPETHKRLRLRAAQHGRSVEAELRQILNDAVVPKAEAGNDEDVSLAEAIRRIFAPLGGVELELPPRELHDSPPKFDE